jgi:hypothetical protein
VTYFVVPISQTALLMSNTCVLIAPTPDRADTARTAFIVVECSAMNCVLSIDENCWMETGGGGREKGNVQ